VPRGAAPAGKGTLQDTVAWCYGLVMRSFLLAMLLLASCAAEEPRRIPQRTPQTQPSPVAAAVEARPVSRATAVSPAVAAAPAGATAPAAATVPAAAAGVSAAAPAGTAAAVAVADPRVATRRAVHAALVEHCGECHEGHRATAKPAALAIFDLDLPDWPARFDDERSEVALKRLARRPAARDAFLAFRDAERAAVSLTGN
jgi:hypothetical protein